MDAGRAEVGSEFIAISPTGTFRSVQDFENLLISGEESDRQIYLRDVANVKRGYVEPQNQVLRYDGNLAIGIGISTVSGGNVVTMGKAIEARLQELAPQIPLGVQLGVISLQSEAVTTAIDGFLNSLMQAVVIVVAVLLVFMGLRSGLIIGFILALTIIGTFIFMGSWHVALERISLGALIIALGMLVDNAIVVVDGMLVRIAQGEKPEEAAQNVVNQTALPLLGATAVAIMAFGAIASMGGPNYFVEQRFFRDAERIDRGRHAAVDRNLQQHLADLVLRAAVTNRAFGMDLQLVIAAEAGELLEKRARTFTTGFVGAAEREDLLELVENEHGREQPVFRAPDVDVLAMEVFPERLVVAERGSLGLGRGEGGVEGGEGAHGGAGNGVDPVAVVGEKVDDADVRQAACATAASLGLPFLRGPACGTGHLERTGAIYFLGCPVSQALTVHSLLAMWFFRIAASLGPSRISSAASMASCSSTASRQRSSDMLAK